LKTLHLQLCAFLVLQNQSQSRFVDFLPLYQRSMFVYVLKGAPPHTVSSSAGSSVGASVSAFDEQVCGQQGPTSAPHFPSEQYFFALSQV
jgi:hypothetical protein